MVKISVCLSSETHRAACDAARADNLYLMDWALRAIEADEPEPSFPEPIRRTTAGAKRISIRMPRKSHELAKVRAALSGEPLMHWAAAMIEAKLKENR